MLKDSEIDREIEDIERKVKRIDNSNRKGSLAALIGLSIFFIWVFGSLFLLVQVVEMPLRASIYLVGVLLSFFATFVVSSHFSRKARKYQSQVLDYEWVKWYSHSVIINLSGYLKTSDEERKKECKKKAISFAEGFLSYLKGNWSYNDTELNKNTFGNSATEFLANFQNKVIPNLSSEDKGTIDGILNVMRNLFYSARGIKLENIDHENENMSKLPQTTLKVGRFGSLPSLILNAIKKHGLFLLMLMVVWLSIDAAASYVGLNVEAIFPMTVAGVLFMLDIYLRLIKKTT